LGAAWKRVPEELFRKAYEEEQVEQEEHQVSSCTIFSLPQYFGLSLPQYFCQPLIRWCRPILYMPGGVILPLMTELE